MDQKDFFIRHSKQIIKRLEEIAKKKCSLYVTIDNEQHFLTSIVEIDANENILKFDASRDEALNRQLLTANKVLFRTEVSGIKVSFKGDKIKQQADDHSLFVMPVPEAIYWMQRREGYRLRVPYDQKTILELVLNSTDTNQSMDTFIKKIKINDIGIDGFSFFIFDNDLQRHFESNIEKLVGVHIKGSLILDVENKIRSDIEFALKSVEKIKNGRAGQYRLGCQFTNITPLFQASVQQFMHRIELEARAEKNA